MTDPTKMSHAEALGWVLEQQSQLMESAHAGIERIEAEADSADGLVRVRVSASGALIGVTLRPGSERVGRQRLGDSITQAAKEATRRAGEQVARELDALNAAHEQVLRSVASIDSVTADALRRTSQAVEVSTSVDAVGAATERNDSHERRRMTDEEIQAADDAYFERLNGHDWR